MPRRPARSVPASASTSSTSSSRRASASRPSRTWTLLVLIVAAPPRLTELELVLIPAPRGEVENLVGAHQGLDATGVRGISVIDSAVLEREDTQTLPLRFGRVDMPEVVVGALGALLFGEGGAEVVVEVGAERRNPRESPSHLSPVVLELRQWGYRRTNEGNVAAVQMRDDAVEVIGDQGAPSASLALVGEPESAAEHEVIDEKLRAPLEEIRERRAPCVGLESIRLIDPHPREPLPPPRQLVAAPRVFLLRLEQLEPRGEPLTACAGDVLLHRPF